jgi:serine/threonine protein kinase
VTVRAVSRQQLNSILLITAQTPNASIALAVRCAGSPMHLPSRHVVGRELGRGGMGVVYEADDKRLGRKVAIKILHGGPEHLGKQRFAREARAASALNHPNIITIHDTDAADDGDFIVMELVEGVSLSRLSRDGPMAVDRAIDYGMQIAGALAASHSADIVHRDLKPANVMVTREGLIKVLDFGLAKSTTQPTGAADAATMTGEPHSGPGVVVGTSGYMSPEQMLGQGVSQQSIARRSRSRRRTELHPGTRSRAPQLEEEA